MSYRYPFTPFPKSWYRIEADSDEVVAFGKKMELNYFANGNLALKEIGNPTRMLPVIKKNKQLFAFYDEARAEPYFDVPDVPEFDDHEWQKPFYLSWKKVRVHAQEVVENAIDLSHFCTVHTYKEIPVVTEFQTADHMFKVVMHSSRKVLGLLDRTSMEITYHGIGIVVANVRSTRGVTLKVLLMTTPIDQECVDIHMGIAIKKTWNPIKNRLLRWLLPREVKAEFSRDIPVWEAKIYRKKPLLCGGEANIVRVRKWAEQFYAGPAQINNEN